MGAPGLPRDAEEGLSGIDVLRFGGALAENPGISDGFHAPLDLTVGEVPRECAELLVVADAGWVAEEDRAGGADALVTADGVDGRRVGVADLEEALLGATTDGLDVGVEALAAAGVDDLGGAAVAGFEGTEEALEVGVEGRRLLEVTGKVGRPVGAAGPRGADDGVLRVPPPPEDAACCLDAKISLAEEEGSRGLDSCIRPRCRVDGQTDNGKNENPHLKRTESEGIHPHGGALASDAKMDSGHGDWLTLDFSAAG